MSQHTSLRFLPQDPRERLAVVAVILAGLFVFGGDISRWVTRTKENLRTAFREKMPIDIEIERAREMASSLMPDLRRNHEVIVREQIETEELRDEIQKRREQLREQREQLLALRSQLNPAAAPLLTTSSDSSGLAIRQTLRQQFDSFQTAQSTQDAKEQMLKYREESLAKAQAAQNEMLTKKKELEAQVLQLEARVQLIRREGVDSHVTVDREKLARCEELLAYLRKRLSVAERVAEFPDTHGPEFGATDADSSEDRIESEIDRYFNRDES